MATIAVLTTNENGANSMIDINNNFANLNLFSVDSATPLNGVTRTLTSPTNLLGNSSFEYWFAGTSVAPTAWTLGGDATVARSATAKVGTYSAAITFGTANSGELYQEVAITTSISYTLSCYVQRTSGTGNARLVAQRADSPYTEYASVALSTTAGWQLAALTAIPLAGINLKFAIKSTDTTASTWLVDACMYQQSAALANPWQPIPIDDTTHNQQVYGKKIFQNGISLGTNSGYLGVGTDAPTSPIHVVSSATDAVAIYSTGTNCALHITSANAATENTMCSIASYNGALGVKHNSYHNSASPAASDIIFRHLITGNDSGGSASDYASISVTIENTLVGSESAKIGFATATAGVLTSNFQLKGSVNGISIGDGASTGIIESEGERNVRIRTGGATTGTIDIENGANGDINIDPNGTGVLNVKSAATATAGGVEAIRLGNNIVGIYFGSGAPSATAPKGSLYLRTDGSSTSTRAYINTDAGTTWTAITTAA